jgi:hypothetical protein
VTEVEVEVVAVVEVVVDEGGSKIPPNLTIQAVTFPSAQAIDTSTSPLPLRPLTTPLSAREEGRAGSSSRYPGMWLCSSISEIAAT